MLSNPATLNGYAPSAHRYYGGTQANGLYAGVGAAIDFMETIGMANIHRRIKSLGQYTQSRLLEFEGKVEVLTPTEEKSYCGVNSFRIKGVSYNDFFNKCVDSKIRIRSVPENNLDCSRISTHIYNNKQEIDQLIEVLKKAV
jgi:L-cysteine/cystine lyase